MSIIKKIFSRGMRGKIAALSKVLPKEADANAADAARYQALAANAASRNRLQNVDALRNLMAKGGAVGSASKRADGIASKGKTKGRVL
jgi:hypothetical protein